MERVPVSEEQIFEFARQLDSSTLRSEYLEQACGGDTVLKERVAGLLELHKQHESYLENPPAELAATVNSRIVKEKPGDIIGSYKLLQKIGEGGFGVVYMAEQSKPVRRKVAFKVIKPGMDTREVVARFEAERQALALMDHPNIAKVLDGGETESGRPFFAMELVKGVPLTQYCDEHKLATTERLNLFSTICRAIQHAHQKGIIHRDIKPSNVMVTLHDGQPVPKVIDFGVSKAINQQLTEKTLFTNYGQMIGTPQYMSPEQAEMSGLDVDTRSDIYSLGILLYELLTGTTPLEAKELREAGFAKMQRLIKEKEPPKPSTRVSGSKELLTAAAKSRSMSPDRLRSSLRGELDWIVMKSIEKDRNRRYETANGLVRDIERFLTSEPVSAGPPGATYRLKKLVNRNRGLVLSSLAVFALLMVSLTVAAVAYVRERRNNQTLEIAIDNAEQAAKNEQAARIELQAKTLEAQQARDVAQAEARKAQLLNSTMTKILAGTETTSTRGKTTTVKDLLDNSLESIDPSLPAGTEYRADVLAAIGNSYLSIDDTSTGISRLEEAVNLYSNLGLQPKHIATRLALSVAKREPSIALEALEDAQELKDDLLIGKAYHALWLADRKMKGNERHDMTLRGIEALERADGGKRIHEYAVLCHWLGQSFCYRGQPEAGILWEKKALDHFDAYFPNSIEVGFSLENLCRASRNLGRFDDAEKYGRRLHKIDQIMASTNAYQEGNGRVHFFHFLSAIELNGRFAEAQQHQLDFLREVETSSWRGPKFRILTRLAWFHLAQGNREGARDYFEMLGSVFPDESNRIGAGARLFAAELRGEPRDVQVDWLNLPKFKTPYIEYYHPDARGFTKEHCYARSILTRQDPSQGALHEVEKVLKERIATSNGSIWSEDADNAHRAMLCWCKARLGQQDEALEILEGLPCKPSLDANAAASLRYREAEVAVVEMLREYGELETAERVLRDGLRKRQEQLIAPNHAQIAFCQVDLASILIEQAQREGSPSTEKMQAAVGFAKQAYEILENHPIAPQARAQEAAKLLAKIYRAWDKEKEAALWSERA